MERNGSSISAIPSTGALDNESLLFIWEGDAGFPLPTQFRNKRSDCGSGSVRLIARPQLRREVVPSQHTRGWPPEKPLPSFLGVCPRAVAGPGARAGARPCLLARFPRFRCARTTPDPHLLCHSGVTPGKQPGTSKWEQGHVSSHLGAPEEQESGHAAAREP